MRRWEVHGGAVRLLGASCSLAPAGRGWSSELAGSRRCPSAAALIKFGGCQIVDATEVSTSDGIRNERKFYETGCVIERTGIAGWVGNSMAKKNARGVRPRDRNTSKCLGRIRLSDHIFRCVSVTDKN